MKYAYLLPLALLASGCVQTYRLGAGLHTHDLFYQARPITPQDSSVATATYVGGQLVSGNGYTGRGNGQHDSHTLGILQASRAHSWRTGAVSYGAFGYLGEYRINKYTFSEYDANKQILPSAYEGTYGFYGWGLRGSAYFNTVLGRSVSWRFAGVEWAFSQEYGDLYDVRQRIPEQRIPRGSGSGYDEWFIARSRSMATVALASELEILNGPTRNKAFVFRYAVGKSLPDYTRAGWFNTVSFAAAYHYYRHAFHFHIGNTGRKSAFQIGYQYRLGLKHKTPRS